MGEPLGKRIRRLRLARGMSIYDLAREAGVSAPFVSHVETGRSWPGERTMRALARALNVTPASLTELRLTRNTQARLQKDPELLLAVAAALRNRQLRKRILDALKTR